MEAKIVPYKPIFCSCRKPYYRVYAKKVLLRICNKTILRWSLVADCFDYNEAKSVADTIEMIDVK